MIKFLLIISSRYENDSAAKFAMLNIADSKSNKSSPIIISSSFKKIVGNLKKIG